MSTHEVDDIIRRYHEADQASRHAKHLISEATRIKNETARAMKAEGATNRTIALALGVSHQRVSLILMASDHVPTPKKKRRPAPVTIPWKGDNA